MIFYPYSDPLKGGEICLHKLNVRQNNFDVFPPKKNLSIKKKFKVIIILVSLFLMYRGPTIQFQCIKV